MRERAMVLTVLSSKQPSTEDVEKYSSSTKEMTPEIVLDICKERNMWSLAHLNSQLYLNYKGFSNIGGLENYTAVRSLHLGNNNIAKIEGLDRMLDLRSLHLDGNRIRSVEGLENNLELRHLNLESNSISSTVGLSHLTKLEQVNLSHNCIKALEDLSGLKGLPKLSNIDVSHNQLEQAEEVVEFWTEFAPSLRLLRFHANPGVRFVEHYRKRLINALPLLSYLDERPVFPIERRSSKAWEEGGMEAMQQAKRDHAQERTASLITFDAERSAKLTEMRKMALARIEREEKEKQEQEEKRREALHNSSSGNSDLNTADEKALSDYAQKWQTKLNLHGADGLREKIAKEDSAGATGGSQMSMQRATPAASPPTSDRWRGPSHTFVPPARQPETHQETTTGHVLEAASAPERCKARQQQASDFRQRDDVAGNATRERDVGWERQFAALGHDPWGGTAGGITAASAPTSRGGVGGAGAAGNSRSGASGGEAVPLIWQKSQAANMEAEMECLNQSMENSMAARRQKDGLEALD